MAEKTHHETTLSQSEAAEFLQTLGTDLSADPRSWVVPVGNKDVEVHPDSRLNLETTVDERSRLLGDDITEVTVQLRWKERDQSTGEGSES